jgi:hypothetical protein
MLFSCLGLFAAAPAFFLVCRLQELSYRQPRKKQRRSRRSACLPLRALCVLRRGLALALALVRRSRLRLRLKETLEATLLLRVQELCELFCALSYAILAEAHQAKTPGGMQARARTDALEALLGNKELHKPVNVRRFPLNLCMRG